jgi:hypothetical protein
VIGNPNREGGAPVDGSFSQPVSRQAVIEAGNLLLQDIATSPRNVVVAVGSDGRPVGAAGFYYHGAGFGVEITSMLSFIPPGSRVGTALLQGIFDRAKKLNSSNPVVRLQAIPGSEAFYVKAGARFLGDGVFEFISRPK